MESLVNLVALAMVGELASLVVEEQRETVEKEVHLVHKV